LALAVSCCPVFVLRMVSKTCPDCGRDLEEDS
jgi:hypothetical protein